MLLFKSAASFVFLYHLKQKFLKFEENIEVGRTASNVSDDVFNTSITISFLIKSCRMFLTPKNCSKFEKTQKRMLALTLATFPSNLALMMLFKSFAVLSFVRVK